MSANNALYKRKNSPTRGRHLVSTQCIQKGSLISTEKPLLSLQSVGNAHQGALCCRCCRAFVGGPHLALLVTSGTVRREDVWDYYSTHEDELTRSCNGDGSGDVCENYKIFPCRNGCGEIFCSKSCEERSWNQNGHDLLCTGCISEPEGAGDEYDELHPLLQFKVHAVQNNEILIMVGDLVATIVSLRRQQIDIKMTRKTGKNFHHDLNNSDQDQLNKIMAPYLDFTLVPWWEVATAPLIADPTKLEECSELEKVMRKMCRESANLLKKAMMMMLDGDNNLFCQTLSKALSDCDHIFSEEFFGKIIGSFEQNAMGIRARHPLCRDIFNLDLRTKRHNELIGCIEVAGMIDGESDYDEVDGDDHVGTSDGFEVDVEDNEDRYTVDEISLFLSELYINESDNPVASNEDVVNESDSDLSKSEEEKISSGDELDNIFTPLDGTAMYYTTCKMNHSCEPNVLVRYNYSCSGGGLEARWGENFPLVLQCIALRDIEDNEELCISYINNHGNYPTRKKQLANYGFECSCPKCVREISSKMGNSRTDILPGISCVEISATDEEDLFGEDDQSETSGEDIKHTNAINPGATKLMELEILLNRTFANSYFGKVPICISAAVYSVANQLGTHLLRDFQSLEGDKASSAKSLETLLRHALHASRERDTHTYFEAALQGEKLAMSILHKFKCWPSSTFREAHRFFSVLLALAFADYGQMLPALRTLDKAAIFGLSRRLIEGLYRYVELHSSSISSVYDTSLTQRIVLDYSSYEMRSFVLKEGLSKPIRYPTSEVDRIPNNLCGYEALAIRDFATKWKALEKWRNLDYFAETLGNRIVPIEHGGMMDKKGMREELMTFKNFVLWHLEPSASRVVFPLHTSPTALNSTPVNIAYLAQHQLFDQIELLLDDIDPAPSSICCESPPKHLNAWIGTGGTRTPLHFDSYDNLLVQLVGCKYVRLYDKSETENLYVIREGASYANQGNMSAVDCEKEDISCHPLVKKAHYTEVVLFPGDALYIPSQTWHYVRSLSTSASVNYWW